MQEEGEEELGFGAGTCVSRAPPSRHFPERAQPVANDPVAAH